MKFGQSLVIPLLVQCSSDIREKQTFNNNKIHKLQYRYGLRLFIGWRASACGGVCGIDRLLRAEKWS